MTLSIPKGTDHHVKKLIHTETESNWSTFQCFNLQYLRPEIFKDPVGNIDRDWNNMGELLGTKRNPILNHVDLVWWFIDFDSTRAPPNKLLKKICEVTGRSITNEYEEWWCDFEWTYECRVDPYEGIVMETDDERKFVPYCDWCWNKRETCRRVEDEEETLCTDCYPLPSKQSN